MYRSLFICPVFSTFFYLRDLKNRPLQGPVLIMVSTHLLCHGMPWPIPTLLALGAGAELVIAVGGHGDELVMCVVP